MSTPISAVAEGVSSIEPKAIPPQAKPECADRRVHAAVADEAEAESNSNVDKQRPCTDPNITLPL